MRFHGGVAGSRCGMDAGSVVKGAVGELGWRIVVAEIEGGVG